MNGPASRPRLLVLSHVLPFPGHSGQQQRVFYSLRALREFFHVTFVTVAAADEASAVSTQLAAHCDDAVVLPARYSASHAARLWHRVAAGLFCLRTGLKPSNYIIGRVEFAAARLAPVLDAGRFDCALFEYWHAHESIPEFRARSIPCVLDMHNVLWQSYARDLNEHGRGPQCWRDRALRLYTQAEESAWNEFDGVIAINAGERDYTRSKVRAGLPVFFAPMGLDTQLWPRSWSPQNPPRLAYYGGLNSPHNAQSAQRCHDRIMPRVWKEFPDAELWLIGNQPPESLRALAQKDARVKVTGFVEHVQDVLSRVSVLLCPWTGTYGFRSRLIEAMSLGVPVVASPDAVFGMELETGRGLFLAENDDEFATHALRLLREPGFASEQSGLARAQVDEHFSYEASYVRLARELQEFAQRSRPASA